MSPEYVLYGSVALLGVFLVWTWWTVLRLLKQAFTPRVFISYRRGDLAVTADMLCRELSRRYGASNVFLDRRSLEPAEPYPHALAGRLGMSNVVVALAGPHWDGGMATGYPRVLQRDDWVRHEVEAGLNITDAGVAQKLLLVVAVRNVETDEKGGIPGYSDAQLGKWDPDGRFGLRDHNALLQQIRQLQAIDLDTYGTGYDKGLDTIIRAIDRRRPWDASRLVRAWRWCGLPLIAGFIAAACFTPVLERKRTADEFRRVDGDVKRVNDDVGRERSRINTLNPVRILPHSFEQFAGDINGLSDEQVKKQYGGGYVAWGMKYHMPLNAGDKPQAMLKSAKSPPPKGDPYVRAYLADGEQNRWVDVKKADPVWVVGRITNYTSKTAEIVLEDVRRYQE
jgi:hypothetical protein